MATKNIKKQYRLDSLTVTLIEILAEQKGINNTELVRNAVFFLASSELSPEELADLIAMDKISEELSK